MTKGEKKRNYNIIIIIHEYNTETQSESLDCLIIKYATRGRLIGFLSFSENIRNNNNIGTHDCKHGNNYQRNVYEHRKHSNIIVLQL